MDGGCEDVDVDGGYEDMAERWVIWEEDMRIWMRGG